ncbi:MAG TPA: alpha/beta hydrolase [Terriglobia bacterium]|nr:alpha/beta hydrolase [Terriglobia bacterium]
MRRTIFRVSLAACVVLPAGAFWYFSEADIPRATLEAKYASAPSQFVALPDGARAHVRDRGPRDGRPLVLIHGSNASLFTWEPWAKRLGDTFRVISVDMPGHGLTGAVPDRDYSQEGMVKFVGEVADALGLQRFAIGGNSMGGRIAARFAQLHPDRVTHLVLVDAGGLPSKRVDSSGLVLRLARTPILNRVLLYITPRSLVVDGLNEAILHRDIITDEMINSYWDFVRMEGTRNATITRINTRDKSIKDHIGDIKALTLILWGEEDQVIPIDAGHEFHATIPGSKLIVYPRTGHIPQEEVADASAADVRAFLIGTQTSRR